MRARKAPHDDAVARPQLAVRVAVEVHARVRAAMHEDLDLRIAGDRDRPVGQRVRAHRHDREHRQRRVQDRPAGRQRVGGGAGRRRHDQAVGAQVVDELAVDAHLELDQAAVGALGDTGVVERPHVEQALVAPPHLGGEQQPRLGDVLAVEDRADGVEHGVERDVGEEAEPALIDADQRHVERRQRARDVEHGAVAADHDGQIGELAGSLQRHDLEVVAGDVRRGDRVEQHAHAARLQVGRQPQQRLADLGALVLPDQRDGLELGRHARIKA